MAVCVWCKPNIGTANEKNSLEKASEYINKALDELDKTSKDEIFSNDIRIRSRKIFEALQIDKNEISMMQKYL